MGKDICEAAEMNQILRRVRAVMFDMDGTLTVPNIDFNKMRKLAGIAAHQPIVETIETFPREKKDIALKAIRMVAKEARENQELMHGTQDLLKFLKTRNIPAAILTKNDGEAVDFFVESLE
eukprot:Ihof_evm3s492 gene=Ihof_evmTU3s492